MPTNDSRDEMLARGRAKGGAADQPLITDVRILGRKVLSIFDLYAFDGSYLGSCAAESAQAAYDAWLEMHGEAAGLVEELD